MAFNPPGFVKPTERSGELMDQALYAGSASEKSRPLAVEFLENWVKPPLVVGGVVALTWASFVRVAGVPPTPRGLITMFADALDASIDGLPAEHLRPMQAPLAGYPGYDVRDGLSADTVHLDKIDFDAATFDFYVVLLRRVCLRRFDLIGVEINGPSVEPES